MRDSAVRRERLAEAMREVLSELLLTEIKDPRLAGVVISAVELSGDLKLARAYFSIFGDDERERQAADGLQQARGSSGTRAGGACGSTTPRSWSSGATRGSSGPTAFSASSTKSRGTGLRVPGSRRAAAMSEVTRDPAAAVARMRQAKRVLITSHAAPDGDAIGSELGFAELAAQMGAKTAIFNRDPTRQLSAFSRASKPSRWPASCRPASNTASTWRSSWSAPISEGRVFLEWTGCPSSTSTTTWRTAATAF